MLINLVGVKGFKSELKVGEPRSAPLSMSVENASNFLGVLTSKLTNFTFNIRFMFYIDHVQKRSKIEKIWVLALSLPHFV